MNERWFKPSSYRHLDRPVSPEFQSKVTSQGFAAQHSFTPFLCFIKKTPRSKKEVTTGKRIFYQKEREIMYASHRDSCLFRYYSSRWSQQLENYYHTMNLHKNVIAYRSLGLSNYEFAAEAYRFALENEPAVLLAYDFKDFFGSLNHSILKSKLKNILNVESLSDDDYAVFKNMTNYHYVMVEDLDREADGKRETVSPPKVNLPKVGDLKRLGIKIHGNTTLDGNSQHGIPQGAPVSSVLSNIYMIDFDRDMKSECDRIGAFYRRYSDDILVICAPDFVESIDCYLRSLVQRERLTLQEEKTEVCYFHNDYLSGPGAINYLGIRLQRKSVGLRESTLARQYGKLRRAIHREHRKARTRHDAGNSSRAYTNNLRKRFNLIGTSNHTRLRNFSSYARSCATTFEGEEVITRQIVRFERTASKEIEALKNG